MTSSGGRIMPDYSYVEYAKNKLRTRTSKILGGYLSEHLFENKFIEMNPGQSFSKGWFGGCERLIDNTYGDLVFFIVKETLNDLDIKVKERLEQNGFRCMQAFLGGASRDIIYVIEKGRVYDYRDYIIEKNLVSKNQNKPKPIYNDVLIEKCIEHIQNYGILKEVAESIFIEDEFLNQYHKISNLDYLVEDKSGNPAYVEVKFKDEFSPKVDGEKYKYKQFYFGSDVLQYDYLFRAFTESGMNAVIMVLYNEVKSIDYHMKRTNNLKNDDTGFFDYLERRANENFIWKFKNYNPAEKYDLFFSEKKDARKMNWRKDGYLRGQHMIPIEKYSNWGIDNGNGFFDKTKNPEGTWGECPICQRGKRILIKNGMNRIWGCTNCKMPV